MYVVADLSGTNDTQRESEDFDVILSTVLPKWRSRRRTGASGSLSYFLLRNIAPSHDLEGLVTIPGK